MGHSDGPPVLWIAGLVAAIFIGIPAVAIGIAMALRARRSRTELTQPEAVSAQRQASRVTWFGLTGLGAGMLLGVVLIVQGVAILAAFSCGSGYLLGLLVGEYAAQPGARGQLRSATLRVRRPADYAPRWAIRAIAAAGLLILTALVIFAVVPAIRYGPWHPFPGQSFTQPGGATSWPGLGGLLAGVAVSLVTMLLGVAGLRRIAARPQLTDASARALDELLRRQAGRAMAGAVLSLQLVLLALFLIAGSSGLDVPVRAVSGAAYLGHEVMVLAGLGCALGAVASWLILSGWIRRPPQISPGTGAVLGPQE
jgi:hypothetical protein